MSPLGFSRLGLGGAPFGNLYRSMDGALARQTIDAAFAAGIAYVDTAPFYGFGLSERRIGDAVRSRLKIVVSTKVGRLLDPNVAVTADAERFGFRSAMPFAPRFAYDYDAVMRSWEASLQRLGLARINLLYVHDIGRLTHGDDADRHFRDLTDGGGLRALEELRAGGAIDGFGVGVNEVAAAREVMAVARLDAILLAGRYTLLEQAPLDDLLPECLAAGTKVVIGGPYNSGILATGTREPAAMRYDYAAAPAAVVARVQQIEAIAARHDVLLPAAALQFVLAHPAVASVIPGLDTPARVSEAVALLARPTPREFWQDLRAAGVLRADAPLPAGAA